VRCKLFLSTDPTRSRISQPASVVANSGETLSADVDFARTSNAETQGDAKGAFMKIKKTGIKGGKVVWGG